MASDPEEATVADAPAEDPPTGIRATRLGRYELGAQLGAGGMAVVYQGRDPTLDRDLAIKLIRPLLRGPAAQTRLLREAQAMARLEHPCVVPIFDVGVAGDDVYIVMPLLGGGTLGEWIHAAPRPWRAVLDRFLAAARGLAAAHAAGVVHRDFKPDNVLVSAAGDVRVGDFGLAHSEGPSGAGPREVHDTDGDDGGAAALELTATGVRIGTPAYMAPEQIVGGAVDGRSDQFAFCVALWEGLYGQRPFQVAVSGPGAREPVLDRMLAAIRTGTLGPVPASRETPSWLHAAVVRGLSPDPAARWPSMQALIDHLESRRRRRAQVGIAVGVGAPVAIVVAAISVGATGARTPAAPAVAPDASRGVRMERVTNLERVAAAALSLDGERLALVIDGAVHVISTKPGSEPQIRLARGATAEALAWNPYGDVMVSTTGGRTMVPGDGRPPWAMASHGTTGLAHVDGHEYVSVDPDGTHLEFHATDDVRQSRRCAVPDDIRHVAAIASDGRGAVALVGVLADRSHVIVGVDRSCHEQGRIAAPGWAAGLAVADRHFWYLRHVDPAAPDDDDDERVLVARTVEGKTVEERRLDGPVVGLAGVAAGGVAYVVRAEGRWRADELDLGGGKPRPRASGADPTEVKPAPDGAWLAWIEDDNRRALHVAAYEDVASRPARIAINAWTVAWSPDGQRLAAVIDVGHGDELRVFDRKGAVLGRVPVKDIDREDGMVWDGDGAVVATSADSRNLVRIDVTTGAATLLLDGRGTASEPEVAPDGTIAFLAARDDGGEGVWLRDPRGKLSRLRAGKVSTLRIAWTASGDAVLVHDLGSSEVWRFPRKGAGAPLVTVPLPPGERLSRLFTALDGRVFARVGLRASDVHASRPAR